MASTYAAQSPADVLNIALTRMGYKLRVGSLLEGSLAAKKALDIYAQTRDEMLRDGDWTFASRTVVGTLLKSAPPGGYFPPLSWDPVTYPPPQWAYAYAYPADCLKVRAVFYTPAFIPNFDPQPSLYDVVNDNGATPSRRIVVTNVAGANITYTGQITDPNLMPPDFISAFADSLGEGLSALLANPDMLKALAAEQEMVEGRAAATQG